MKQAPRTSSGGEIYKLGHRIIILKHRRKGICARLRATGPAAIIDYHHVHLNHITKLLAMTNS